MHGRHGSSGAVPVTVKCRIGVDEQDPEEALVPVRRTRRRAGCQTFIVHARKAWLKGLSPKENREIPPLDYALVHALKRERPELTIVLNGGLRDLDQARPTPGGPGRGDAGPRRLSPAVRS